VSIASDLVVVQEEKVLDVSREPKEAMGWTIEDTKPQRRLNPAIQEVQRADVIIYPIFDSEWVSPIHVMTKWAGLMRVKNKDDDFVPTCIQLGWRAWIDYHKVYVTLRSHIGKR
jgi:hypothetical protein